MEPGEPVLRVVPMARDVNVSGDVFGGWLMSQADIAGSVLAYREARGRVATVGVRQFDFRRPVFVGDVVSFYAAIERVGTTSITVTIEIFADRRPPVDDYREERVLVAQATIVYVAIDSARRPRPVFPSCDSEKP
ncbi:MAG: acyl-CoA thioesterase [Acidiferrobacteraceae bacterium]